MAGARTLPLSLPLSFTYQILLLHATAIVASHSASQGHVIGVIKSHDSGHMTGTGQGHLNLKRAGLNGPLLSALSSHGSAVEAEGHLNLKGLPFTF